MNVRPGASILSAMTTRSLPPALLIALVCITVALTVLVVWNSVPDFTPPAVPRVSSY